MHPELVVTPLCPSAQKSWCDSCDMEKTRERFRYQNANMRPLEQIPLPAHSSFFSISLLNLQGFGISCPP